MLWRLVEDVPLVADVGHDRHHELLADRVDRRVRDLREELVEAVEEAEAPLPQARKRRVVAHRADRLVPGFGHGPEDELDVLQRVAEAPLLRGERVRAAWRLRRHDLREEAGDRDVVLVHPAAVGAAAGVERLDLRVLHEPVALEVQPEHRPRLHPAAAGDRLRRNVENAGLGGEDEEPVLGERPARGTEAVAVEGRAEALAVGERQRRGAVPRLHQRRVVLVECAHVVAHVVLRAPRLGNEHHHRVRGIAPGRDQQLEHVVERGGVGLPRVDDRQQLLQLVAEERRGERRLARGKRVEVALERVDLAVVRDGAERVGELPGRKGVGGVPLVDDRERRDEVRVREVGVEPLDLGRQQQPLVDNRPRRAGADVRLLRRLLDLAADDIKPTLESRIFFTSRLFCVLCVLCGYKQLPYPRHHCAGVASDGVGIGRHVAPAEDLAPLGLDRALDLRLLALAAENHRNPVWHF